MYAKFPDWFQTVMNSGISAGCLTAIVLNLLFDHLPTRSRSDVAEADGLPGGVHDGVDKPREEAV